MKKLMIVVMAVTILGCCAFGVQATQEEPLQIYRQVKRGGAVTYKILDLDTGVNYVAIKTTNGVAICPRYDADGSLYVEDEYE